MSPKKKVKSSKIHLEDTVCQDTHDASDRYKKVSHAEHVLLRPEMYIGSMEHHLLQKVPLLKPDVRPILLPKLMKAGPDFDTAFVQLNGGPSVRLRGNFSEEDSEFDENEVPYLNDEFTKEGSENEFAKDADKKELDEEELQSLGESVSDDGLEDGESVVDDGFEDGESAPLIDGKILGVDARLCDTSQKYNAERILGPGSFYYRDVWMHPGLLKIFDEVIVNAADNRLTTPSDGATHQTFIKVFFDKESGRITVANDGNGIPIVKHKDHDLWIPEMIFGHLLTSSHYENDPNSVAAGRHGYGAKLTNIMSSEFTVTCHWKDKVFVGKWSDNMQKCDIQVSSRDYSEQSFTEVSFIPEYSRFMAEDMKKRARYHLELEKKKENDRIIQASQKKMIEMYGEKESKVALRLLKKKSSVNVSSYLAEGIIPEDFDIQNELFCIVQKRCLDLAASIGSEQKVYFNDVNLTPRVFPDYCRMHFPEEEVSRQPFYAAEKEFELAILFQPKVASKSSTSHVSLVNGLVTSQGGNHLRHAQLMVDKVLSEVADVLKAKARVLFNVTLFKAASVFFVNATCHQPKFDSQSKAKLVSKHPFPLLDLSGLKDHILSLPFLNEFCTSANLVDTSFLNIELRKMKERFNARGLSKLVEPSTIGDPKYNHVLILTEGDSAKALAVNSLSLEQRKVFGVFPLRGKVLNVRSHPLKKLMDNVEVMNVFAAIGLTIGEKYESLNKLRYKKILIMTDQDQDGMHIRGLLLNLFQVLWPQLLSHNPGFINIFSTPLVKARLPGNVTKEFYSSRQYDEWRESVDSKVLNSAKIRYYKGLGTSTSDEGREYFKSIENNTTEVIWDKDTSVDENVLRIMFSDTTTNIRKKKMIGYIPTKDSFCEVRQGTVENFVEKDLMKYAIYDNSRSIVSGLDGLKTSNRKVLWALLKRDPPAMRVSQLAGYVSEVSNYHHGETSLHGAIIHMAQNYTTSNNINYLHPEGQFGSRLGGGADSAAPRYIFTKLDPITRLVFPKLDDPHLIPVDSDGELVEPVCYAPVIPTAFLNGETGIGFGFASNFTPHDPIDLINRTRKMMNGESAEDAYRNLTPAYVGFRGTIRRNNSGEFWCFPAVEIFNGVEGDSHSNLKVKYPIDSGHVLPRVIGLRITELPPMMTPDQFRSKVFTTHKDAVVGFSDFSGADHIDMDLRLNTESWLYNSKEPTIECLLRSLGLISKIKAANWTHSDINGSVHSYIQQPERGIAAIAKTHYDYRLSIYEKRLAAIKESVVVEMDRLTSIITFSKMVQSDVSIFEKTEEQLIEFLKEKNVKDHDGSYAFLTNRSIVSFLSMNIASVEKRLQTVILEDKRLKSKTPKDLWVEDLAALEEVCKKNAETKKKNTDAILSQRKIKWKSFLELYKSPAAANARKLIPSFDTNAKRFNINDAIKAEMKVMGWSEESQWKQSVRRTTDRKKLVDRRQKLREAEKSAKKVIQKVKKEGVSDDDYDNEEGSQQPSISQGSAMACSVTGGEAPLTAPFSPMTAPLFTIHTMDTFTLVNAAVAHRTFAWRQHMTTLVRQRVGAIGTPVLGRLISRFIF